MKTYIYSSKKSGEIFEIKQKFGSDALTHHPETGEEIVRLIVSVNFQFKGGGFYTTDNPRKVR